MGTQKMRGLLKLSRKENLFFLSSLSSLQALLNILSFFMFRIFKRLLVLQHSVSFYRQSFTCWRCRGENKKGERCLLWNMNIFN